MEEKQMADNSNTTLTQDAAASVVRKINAGATTTQSSSGPAPSPAAAITQTSPMTPTQAAAAELARRITQGGRK
jgi:hypothetical protein